jgi:chaperonin GroEL
LRSKRSTSDINLNKLRGIINVVAVRAPGFMNYVSKCLRIAVLTGGTVTQDAGLSLDNIQLNLLGEARHYC